MASPRRWFRLDITWSSSAWLVVLRPGARLGWVELLGYVKGHGVAGRAKALPPAAAGKRWGIPTKDVDALLEAATENGALRTENGDWVITGWKTYQEHDATAAERMKRHREKIGGNTDRKAPSRRNARNVRRNPSRDRDVDLDVDSDRERTAGEHARANGAASPGVNGGTPDFDGYLPTQDQVERALELRVDIGVALRKWRAHRKAHAHTPADIAADFDGWLENEPAHSTNGHGPAAPARSAGPQLHRGADDTGIVKLHAPPPPDAPEQSDEARAEIARLAALRKAELQAGPAVPPDVQAERDRKLQLVADADRKAKP